MERNLREPLQPQLSSGARERTDGDNAMSMGAFGNVYARTSQAIRSGYNRTLDYGRAHPGRMSLMTLAAGVGLGMCIAAFAFPRRTRAERRYGPWIDAAADLARHWAWRRR